MSLVSLRKMALHKTLRGFCHHAFHSSSNNLQETNIKLTKDVYQVKRGTFAALNDTHIQQFERVLGKARVLTDPQELESYNVDWIKMVRGYSSIVLKPKTTDEVSAVLKICHENQLAVCPQGGNTGLVGGSVPVFDEVILSTVLMNKIIKINESPGSVVCQAGCVLEALDSALADHGLMMPLDLGAKGSCHIGGNIATNAGGLRLLRYGSLHANTLGLVAVKADGEVIDCMNTLKKDNTGYHLKHLFIGSEGTLGVVTEAAVQCPPKPLSVSLALLGHLGEDIQDYIHTSGEDGIIAELLKSLGPKSLQEINHTDHMKNLDNGEHTSLLENSSHPPTTQKGQ